MPNLESLENKLKHQGVQIDATAKLLGLLTKKVDEDVYDLQLRLNVAETQIAELQRARPNCEPVEHAPDMAERAADVANRDILHGTSCQVKRLAEFIRQEFGA